MTNRQETFRARTVLERASASVNNFLDIYDAFMQTRPKGGAPSDQDQDLLRAAIVFAASGLDSALKELIRGSLKQLAQIDVGVQREFETFVQRQLRGDIEESEALGGIKFLASILASSSPQSKLLNDYVFYLTGASLQSIEQLFKTVKALGVDTKFLIDQKAKLVEFFDARNIIIHELDIKFTGKQGRRNRNIRRRTDTQEQSNTILSVTEKIILEVERKLTMPPANQALKLTE
jgi:hypothetical protein